MTSKLWPGGHKGSFQVKFWEELQQSHEAEIDWYVQGISKAIWTVHSKQWENLLEQKRRCSRPTEVISSYLFQDSCTDSGTVMTELLAPS